MIVGMTTVFLILMIVIYLGKAMIALVNKYAPEEATLKRQAPGAVAASTAGNLSSQDTAAIVAAISIATGGQGKVTKIERL